MKRLGTLVMAILLITGCNAMKPNMEEAELLWQETEKNIQKWAISTNAEASPVEKPRIIPKPTVEIPKKTPTPTEEPAPELPAPTPPPEQDKSVQESADRHEQPTSLQTERHKGAPVMIDWPYPSITCPPEPETTPEIDWPYIVAPEPPTYTPEPEPAEQPQEGPAPTPQPVPVDPAPEPTEQPTEQPVDPTPEPTAEPQTGYAECSCGARLTPEELVFHMKAHALNGESHSYRAY